MAKRKMIGLAVLVLMVCLTAYYFYPEARLPAGVKIDNIVVCKSKRQMQVYAKGELLKTYRISIGLQPKGDKEYKGDNKTPEGIYFINDKNPNSICHKNLGISYPSHADTEAAKRLGRSAGGDIKIHGLFNGFGFVSKFHRWFGFTYGCIMVTDEEIDELYASVKTGTRIEIKP
jgi:murein L,D-transpeptidase YafK